MEENEKGIIFYDGDCGFCNKSIQFILKHRKHNLIKFAPLQSSFAKKELAKHNVFPSMETLYLLKNEKVFDRSNAMLRISLFLKFPFSMLFGTIIVPRFIRDFFYNLIAKNRHKLSISYCVIPNDDEKKNVYDY